MHAFVLVMFLFFVPATSQAQLLCKDIFPENPKVDFSIAFSQLLGIKKAPLDLILNGPFRDSALELQKLFFLINDSLFISQLSEAFQHNDHNPHPEINQRSHWYTWKAQFTLQYPHLILQPADWVHLWNIYEILQQFSQDLSPSQTAWMSAWLLKIVSPEHFLISTSAPTTTPIGPLRALQDPLHHRVYETLLSDAVFKSHISKIIKDSKKYNPNLRQHLFKPKVTLTTSLQSQILVNLTFQVLWSRLNLAIEEYNWRPETPRGLFIPEELDFYLEDLFESPQNQELALHLLKNIFMGTPIPILESEFQALLLASLKQQMRALIDEALNRPKPPGISTPPPAITSAKISATPLPLAEHMKNIDEQQTYAFTMLRNPELGIQTLVFAPGALELFETENIDSISKFMRALQYGFTDANGSNGLKQFEYKNYYELKPGESSYRMIVLRNGKTWTVIATLHKDNVRPYINQRARSSQRPKR